MNRSTFCEQTIEMENGQSMQSPEQTVNYILDQLFSTNTKPQYSNAS